MVYKLELKRNDGTIIEAIVEADNKTAARAKAHQNAKKIVKGQKEESNAFYGKRDYSFILGKLESPLKVISVQIIEYAECKAYFGYSNFYVLLIDDNSVYLTNINMVNNSETAYSKAVNAFHRKKIVEGFIYRVGQPFTVNKNKEHGLNYFYSFKSNSEKIFCQLHMQQYSSFSVIDLGFHNVGLTYIGPHMTIHEMLSKLVPEGSFEEKPLFLLYAKSGLVKKGVNYYEWKTYYLRNGEVEVNDAESDDYKKLAEYTDYMEYITTEIRVTNFINLSEINDVDVISECLIAFENHEKHEAFENTLFELGDKLGSFYAEYRDLMSEKQKQVIIQLGDEFELGCEYDEAVSVDKPQRYLTSTLDIDNEFLGISYEGRSWGSVNSLIEELNNLEDFSFEDFSDDIEPPTKPSKSSKPKSTKSQVSKGRKKKVGK